MRPLIASVPPLFARPGGEVGQERFGPLLERLPEPLDFRHRTGRQGREELLGDPPAFDGTVRRVGRLARCRSVRFSAPQRRMVRIP
jgi:hypothetical protein